MDPLSRTDDIEAGSDPGFERAWWWVQRGAWVVLGAVVAAAVAGLLGRGPLAKATAEGPGLRVEYERFARRHAPGLTRVHVRPGPSGRVRVSLSGEALDGLQLERVVPDPAGTRLLADGAEFTFNADPAAGEATVLFTQQPSAAGRYRVRVASDGGPPAEFTQYVYP